MKKQKKISKWAEDLDKITEIIKKQTYEESEKIFENPLDYIETIDQIFRSEK